MSAPAPVLELDRLSLSFGGLRALSDLDLGVGEREIVSVIGPNGAGKSTVFNVITGVYQPSSGDVRFAGRSIAGLAPHSIARLGIGRTFQSLRLFLNMSVIENVMAATYGNTKAMPWSSPPTPSPTRTGGGSRSPARSPPARGCCCSTSRPRA
jgi:branched-chain amino acid transport system ATP-binding protein